MRQEAVVRLAGHGAHVGRLEERALRRDTRGLIRVRVWVKVRVRVEVRARVGVRVRAS